VQLRRIPKDLGLCCGGVLSLVRGGKHVCKEGETAAIHRLETQESARDVPRSTS
jgi:hypothetical protein